MQAISTYRERVMQGLRIRKRQFVLYPQALELRVPWNGKAAQFDLAEFQDAPPRRDRIRLKIHKNASLGVMISFLVLCGVLLIQIYYPPTPTLAYVFRALAAAAIVPLVACLLLVYLFRKPVETARFAGRNGKILVDILKSGPDAARFEEFTTQFLRQIRKAARAEK